MHSADDGYFSHVEPASASVLRYAYALGLEARELPDPASRWQPDGVHQPSGIYLPEEFEWSDQVWQGISLRELVIYELHVGTFTPQGTFSAIIPRLSELRELGVTAIELMPVAQFPGSRNWGYDGVHPYAVQNTYGGPQEMQKLVDACHREGLAVLLDVVYNHLGPEGNYLGLFGPYFTDRYHTPWGCAWNYDGPESDPVRSFVIESACQWARDFHIDGLRLDAVQAIYDLSARHVLAEIQQAVQAEAARQQRQVVVIAETNQNDPRLLSPPEHGGCAMDAVWSDDFHHSLHALLTGEREGYYMDFGAPANVVKAVESVFVYDGCYSPFHRRRHGNLVRSFGRERFVTCIQNHDQVGNRARGERLSALLSPEKLRLAAALALLAPTTPLLFMGEEYAERNPFLYFCSFDDAHLIEAVRQGRRKEFESLAFAWDREISDPQSPATFATSRLDWRWEGDPLQAGLRRLYHDLLTARRNLKMLTDFTSTSARLESPFGEAMLLCVQHGRLPGATVFANLSNKPLEFVPPTESRTTLLLTTENARYGGRRGNLHPIDELLDFEVVLWGPCP